MQIDFAKKSYTCYVHEQIVRMFSQGADEYSDDGMPVDPLSEACHKALAEHCPGDAWLVDPYETSEELQRALVAVELADDLDDAKKCIDCWCVPDPEQLYAAGFVLLAADESADDLYDHFRLFRRGNVTLLAMVGCMAEWPTWQTFWFVQKPVNVFEVQAEFDKIPRIVRDSALALCDKFRARLLDALTFTLVDGHKQWLADKANIESGDANSVRYSTDPLGLADDFDLAIARVIVSMKSQPELNAILVPNYADRKAQALYAAIREA